MKLVPISSFQKITGISDRAMLQLLERVGKDATQVYAEMSETQGLLLDVDSLKVRDLVEAIRQKQDKELSQKRAVIVEKLGAIVVEEIESIFLEASARASAERVSQKDD